MKIASAAIKCEGKIYEGQRHGWIMNDILNALRGTGVYLDQITKEEGFMTDEGKFVNRYEAGQIAFKAGQIKEETGCLQSFMINWNI